MKFRGPLADSYPAAVALVVCALVPFLTLTAAVLPVLPVLSKELGISRSALDLTFGMAEAAYAFGTVMAVQFAQHLPPRRMLIVYVTAFVVAAGLGAWSPTSGVFIAAFVVEGLCTSLMLIAAVPPLVIGWPASRMPWTGVVMNLCIFGAVAVGPTIGGLQASAGAWRPLFWGVTAVAGLALAFSILTYEDQPPQDTSAPWDWVAIALAASGCAAAFFGASELEATGSANAVSVAPLVCGAAAIALLVTNQFRKKRPLMPVRQLSTTLPVTGIVIAMFASAASFGLMELVLVALQHSSPGRTAVLFLPEFAAAVATAGLFGALFRTRFTPLLAVGGLVTLAVAAGVLTNLAPNRPAIVAVGLGLTGLGVGASVSPALFIAGFSLRSAQIQRVFALIELIRGVTAFLVAPILVFLSTILAGSSRAGIIGAIWICLGIAVLGTLAAAALFLAGQRSLQTPDLDRWQEQGEPAWESRPLLARLRSGGGLAPAHRGQDGHRAADGEPGRHRASGTPADACRR
jgi:MFS family permease